MSLLNQNPGVVVKRKNIQPVIDFCLDHKIECRISPRTLPEEFEVEFSLSDTMKAISLGMFLKEHKLELTESFGVAKPVNNGVPQVQTKAPRAKKQSQKTAEKTEPVAEPAVEETPEIKDEEDIFASTQEEKNPFAEDDLFMQN